MSDYYGDIRLGDTLDIKFTTRQISGAPATLSSSPVISAYPANSTTQLTAGITLSVDFDSVTGYNNVRVVASGGNGYLTATNYDLCITTGTVNSVSVVGESIGSFSIENRSALMPTAAGLTLDVSATGEAGVDWGNVGSKTTANDLTNTTIKTTQKVDVDTIKTNPVVNGGTITFPTTATLASTTNITAGTITTVTNLTNAPTAGDLTATMKTSVQTASDAAVTANSLVNAIAGYIDTEVAAIKAKTDSLTFTAAGKVDANMLATNGDATSAANVAKTTRAIGRCTVGAASTTTSIVTSACAPTGVDADQFKGRIITFDADTTTTGLRGQATDITASTGVAAPVFTVTALTQPPVSGDTFSIT